MQLNLRGLLAQHGGHLRRRLTGHTVVQGTAVQARLREERLRATRLVSLRPRRRIVYALASVKFGLVLLLPLHPTVLKPDLDLTFGEAQRVSNFDPSSPREVSVKVELLFQLQGLVSGVSLSASFPL